VSISYQDYYSSSIGCSVPRFLARAKMPNELYQFQIYKQKAESEEKITLNFSFVIRDFENKKSYKIFRSLYVFMFLKTENLQKYSVLAKKCSLIVHLIKTSVVAL
jgi:hypothetical protein